jgi:hypothetical protein
MDQWIYHPDRQLVTDQVKGMHPIEPSHVRQSYLYVRLVLTHAQPTLTRVPGPSHTPNRANAALTEPTDSTRPRPHATESF